MRWLLCMVMCMTALLTQAALAAESGTASVEVWYIHSDTEFSIYRAAAPEGNGYAPTEAYAAYAIDFDISTSEARRTLASTLAAYTNRDQLKPTAAGVTDSEGGVYFDGLADGIYLVMGSSDVEGEYRYTPTPFVVVLTDGSALKVYAKYDRENSNAYKSCTVQKLWANETSQTGRPDSITVQLLQDGKVADTVVLCEGNGWSCSWEKLDAASDWQVTEGDVPAGYTVKIARDQQQFVITNTYETAVPTPNPTEPTPGKAPDSPYTGDTSQAAQYGLLLAGSFGLFLVTVLLDRKYRKEARKK